MIAVKLGLLPAVLALICFAGYINGNIAYGAAGECRRATTVLRASTYALVTASQGPTRKNIGPEYFGFNLVWTGFQASHWDSSAQQVAPEIVEWMTAFPGAVYRYGSNVSNWRDSVGPVQSRPTRKVESWLGPTAAKFGYDEYLRFVGQVKGQAWVIANIYGAYESELPVEGLASSAADWLRYSVTKSQAGMPSVLRWELGNELDRGKNPWNPEKYSANAGAVASAMTSTRTSPKFVAMLEDYDAFKGMTASQYNRRVIQQLPPVVQDFTQHLYYDGPPGGTTVPNRLAHLCRSIEDVYSVRSDIKPVFWITEHARWPPGDDKPDWNKNWWRSVNLEGALGVADMMIAATQVPEVQGVFLHSMEGTASPWPLFHRMPDGHLQASAVYHALSILRASLLDEVLQSHTESRWESTYFGRYDFRGSVLASSSRDKYAIWAINRHGASITTSVRIPALAGKLLKAKVSVLADFNVNATNALIWNRLRPRFFDTELTFDAKGNASLILPANSITTVSMSVS